MFPTISHHSQPQFQFLFPSPSFHLQMSRLARHWKNLEELNNVKGKTEINRLHGSTHCSFSHSPSDRIRKSQLIRWWEIFRITSDWLPVSEFYLQLLMRKLEYNLSSDSLPSPGKSSLPNMKRLYPHCLSKTSGSIFRAKISDEYKQLSLFFGYRTYAS